MIRYAGECGHGDNRSLGRSKLTDNTCRRKDETRTRAILSLEFGVCHARLRRLGVIDR